MTTLQRTQHKGDKGDEGRAMGAPRHAPAALSKIPALREAKLLAVRDAKEAGVPVVGLYCTYSPRELVLAAGGIPVALCGYKQDPLPAASRDLPANLCPVVKTLYDLAATDTCPYFHFCDILFAQTTCDGRKKAYEFMGRLKPLHIMDLPQLPDAPHALSLWRGELERLKQFLETHTGRTITEEALRDAARATNREMRLLKRLFDANRRIPAPLSGRNLLEVMSVTAYSDVRGMGLALAEELLAEIDADTSGKFRGAPASAPRVLLTGVPVGIETGKVIELVEDGGGAVVAMENCGGYKVVDYLADEEDPRDMLTVLAEKYLRIPCSVMSPNTRRLELLGRMARDFAVQGVIDLTWQSCHTYNIESTAVGTFVRETLGLPFLHIETDFSPSDRENLRTRIEAFLEIL
jgi:benzoyl-CoA reductase/2-hydroxyglutaryl-CoA dehydratase subunit BcrC/BadD/HgdB